MSSEHRVPRQLQLAWYAGDAASHYSRHLDACLDSVYEIGLLGWLRVSDYRARVLTSILYLNDPDWRPGPAAGPDGDGGELRLFTTAENGSDTESSVDVIPRGGTLVIFDARRMEHQVMPSVRD